MKKILALIYSICVISNAFSESIIIPPELNWWITEVKKGNISIEIDKFKLVTTEKYKTNLNAHDPKYLYPIFMRRNFSGDKIGYFNLGASLSKQLNGKYSISFDADSSVLILNKDYREIYWDSFGISSGIDAINWLNDNVLIAVGKNIDTSGEKSIVDLIIKKYEIINDQIIVETYYYYKAFDNNTRFNLKLNWYQQRQDYFDIK